MKEEKKMKLLKEEINIQLLKVWCSRFWKIVAPMLSVKTGTPSGIGQKIGSCALMKLKMCMLMKSMLKMKVMISPLYDSYK